ncbi:MAG: hypothetical protein ACPGSG_07710, partial [Prolixibacteraceae bacterium]
GLSIDFALFDGGTMEEPWRNHGQTMKKAPLIPFFIWLVFMLKKRYSVKKKKMRDVANLFTLRKGPCCINHINEL